MKTVYDFVIFYSSITYAVQASFNKLAYLLVTAPLRRNQKT